MKISALFISCAFAAMANAQEFVTYEEFGAVGDGKTDDQKAIIAAHEAANKKGLPVRACDGKTYYIGKGTATAEICTDVDFGTASFVIDDHEVPIGKRTAAIFRIAPSAKPVAIKGLTTLASCQAGQHCPPVHPLRTQPEQRHPQAGSVPRRR